MKKKLIAIAAISLLVFNCNKNRKADNPPLAPTEIAVDSIILPKEATAKNSLDYLGMYIGKLPCADCMGIETTLELSEDFSYVMTSKYLGRSETAIEEKGSFSWNKTGNAIVVERRNNAKLIYLVGENMLTQLDGDGKKINGNLASMFILKKLTDVQAEKSDAEPQSIVIADLTSMHWKLDALNGILVSNDAEKDFHIEFKKDGNFSAFAGCNRMAGHYKIKEGRINFRGVIATMMACAEMKFEEQLKNALETADNFVANQKVLQLRKGGTTLAEFDATPLKSKK